MHTRLLGLLLVLLASTQLTRATNCTVTPSTCVVNGTSIKVDNCGAVGDGVSDDTACWQAALDAAKAPGGVVFGTIEATAGKTYVLTDTVVLNSAFGGVIQGNGAILQWKGTDSTKSMLRFEDTQQLVITNLLLESSPSFPLHTGIEFTNAPGNTVAPIANIVDHVIMDGTVGFGLSYGIRFSNRYGLDGNNDQSTIRDSTIYNVALAAISIEHSQSKQHRFMNVNATGADTNYPTTPLVVDNSANYVRLIAGSFSSIGGYHGAFGDAEYYISGPYDPITIIDSNAENCARLLRSDPGNAWFPTPVNVTGGRFAVNQLAADGRIVDWHRQGPLTIRGTLFDGTWPGSTNPTLYFNAPPPIPGQTTSQAQFEVSGVTFDMVKGSLSPSAWDTVVGSANARIYSHGNLCGDVVNSRSDRCMGIAGGATLSTGVFFAELTSTDANGQLTYCKDCQVAPSGVCASGGSGSFARKENGTWKCSGAEVLTGAAQTLTSKTLNSPTNTFPESTLVSFVYPVSAGTGTLYCTPGGGVCSTTESNVSMPYPRSVLRRLTCKSSAQPGGGRSVTLWVRAGGANAGNLTCTIGSASQSCQNATSTDTYVTLGEVNVDLRAATSGSGSWPTGFQVVCSVITRPGDN